MRREWIEMPTTQQPKQQARWSPSMRREWIEIQSTHPVQGGRDVSLHAEGVD